MTEQSLFSAVLNEVNRLRALYPTYTVKATGHSLGAALALLTAMDLKNKGIPTLVYNFGQPRVGDPKFTSCVASKVPTERVTHLKDTVPHIPYESWGYLHATREAYESSTTATNPVVSTSRGYSDRLGTPS
jgi:predicted lipase